MIPSDAANHVQVFGSSTLMCFGFWILVKGKNMRSHDD